MELINVNITGGSLNCIYCIYTTKLLNGEIHGSFSVFEKIQNISKNEKISMGGVIVRSMAYRSF